MGTTSGRTEGVGGTAGALADLCVAAEATGAGALWAVDHLFWPCPMLECLTTLAVASTATTSPMLGTCILQLPLRRSSAVAKQATALQLLSDGRFILGVGVGSHRGEYEAAGVDYTARGRLLDEGLAAMRSYWGAGDGGDGTAPPVGAGWNDGEGVYAQAPVSRPVPVWVGGSSEAALERAARTADGWVPLFLGPQEYAAALTRLAGRAVHHGRQPSDITPAVVALVHVGTERDAAGHGAQWLSDLYGLPPKAFARHVVAGTADACADGVRAYFAAGARHVAVMVAGTGAIDHFTELVDALGPDAVRTPPAPDREDELAEVRR
jgi:alkanesulfonate monooxygenase SsuD/methylene tetrahydromethanopterin reductase-like flavin-dependent oxidoreductase (luciferase family)